MLNLQAIIQARQYKFYSKFIKHLEPGSPRACVFFALRNHKVEYIQYYSDLINKFESVQALKSHYVNLAKEKIRMMSNSGDHYKFQLYCEFNPELVPADLSKYYSYAFSRLKLSSHSMPIELLRWNRLNRDVRLCNNCKVVGDERHFIYDCPTIDREELNNLPELSELATYEKLPILLKVLKTYL